MFLQGANARDCKQHTLSRDEESNSRKNERAQSLGAGAVIFFKPSDIFSGDGMTGGEATLMLVNLVFNYGVFAVPRAFAEVGHVSGGLCAFFVMTTCLISARLLGHVFLELRKRGAEATYATAAAMAAGPGLAAVMSLWSLLELTCYAVGGMIIIDQTASTLLPGVNCKVIVGGSALIAALMSALSNRSFSYVSLFSALSIGIACGMVLVTGLELPEPAGNLNPFGPASALPGALSVISFGAATHPVLPMVFASVESHRAYEQACNRAWTLWGVSVVVFGMLAYYFFGDVLASIVTKNVGLDLDMNPMPTSRALICLTAFCVLFRHQLSLVMVAREHTALLARVFKFQLESNRGGLVEIIFAAPVFLGLGISALLLRDDIKYLESMTGSMLMSVNGFLFPAFVYLRICKPQSAWLKFGAYLSTAFGLALLSGPGLARAFHTSQRGLPPKEVYHPKRFVRLANRNHVSGQFLRPMP